MAKMQHVRWLSMAWLMSMCLVSSARYLYMEKSTGEGTEEGLLTNYDYGQEASQSGDGYADAEKTVYSAYAPISPSTVAPLPSSSTPLALDNPVSTPNQYSSYYGSGDSDYSSGASGEESSGSGDNSGEESSGSGDNSGEQIAFEPAEESGSGEGVSGSSPFVSASDCPSLSDGNYPLSGCSSNFLTCSNGLPSLMDCPAGLVFNWHINECDWPANLGCENEGEESGSGSGDFFSPSDCPSLPSGNYALAPCADRFLACSNGLPSLMDCPAGLIYNPSSAVCDWPRNVDCEDLSSGQIGSDEPVSVDEGSASSGEASGETPVEPLIGLPPVEVHVTTTTLSSTTMESSGKEMPSGEETSALEPESSASGESLLELSSGDMTTTTMSTSTQSSTTAIEGSTSENGMVTSPLVEESSASGEESEQLRSETSTELMTETVTTEEWTTTPLADSITNSELEINTVPTASTPSPRTLISVVAHPSPFPSPAPDCSSRPDGNYALSRCSTRFLACSNGRPSLMDCPSTLVYNERIDACDFPTSLACGDEQAGSADSLCSSDGVFATEACSARFHSCQGGQLVSLSCDAGQLFSWARETCLPAAEFPECDLH